MEDLVNTQNGKLHFGGQKYISAETIYEEVKKMKGTIEHSFENTEMGIQNLSFFNKEIDDHFYQISFHFHFGKLSMIFIQFKNGKQLTEMPAWNELRRMKNDNHTKHLHEKMQSKQKNYDWGKLHAFYSPKVNLAEINITYKR